MGLFNNKELQDLRAELDSTKSRLDKAESDLKGAAQRAAAANDAEHEVRQTFDALKKEIKELRAENERLLDCRARAEKAASFFEDRFESARRELDFAKEAAESSRVLHGSSKAVEAHLKGENTRLKVELERLEAQAERLKAQLEQARSEIPVVSRDGSRTGQADPDDMAAMRSELDGTRRRLAESEEMRRVAVRKAEHNRRAWLITQMQLDLAEDRLCLITTGKPRPVMEDQRFVCEGDELIEVQGADDSRVSCPESSLESCDDAGETVGEAYESSSGRNPA